MAGIHIAGVRSDATEGLNRGGRASLREERADFAPQGFGLERIKSSRDGRMAKKGSSGHRRFREVQRDILQTCYVALLELCKARNNAALSFRLKVSARAAGFIFVFASAARNAASG